MLVDVDGLMNTDDLQFAPSATPAYFRIVIFNTEDEKIERALSWKRLGFDASDKLVWVSVPCP
jgi:hypothetical protein